MRSRVVCGALLVGTEIILIHILTQCDEWRGVGFKRPIQHTQVCAKKTRTHACAHARNDEINTYAADLYVHSHTLRRTRFLHRILIYIIVCMALLSLDRRHKDPVCSSNLTDVLHYLYRHHPISYWVPPEHHLQ